MVQQHTSYPAESAASVPTSARFPHVLVLSANTPADVREAAARLAEHLKQHPELNIADAAYTLQMTSSTQAYRWFAVCQDHVEAVKALENVTEKHIRVVNQPARKREVAFLFPGLGEQYVELARELYRDEPDFREIVEQCCSILQSRLRLDIRDVFVTEDTTNSKSQQTETRPTLDFQAFVRRNGHDLTSPFAQPSLAHPATFVLEYALTRLLAQWGIYPSAMLGYSLGEYVAACLAGVLSLEDALVLVASRASILQSAPRGAMLAVNLAEKDVHPYLSQEISLAVVSSPMTCVLAGTEQAIKRLKQHFLSSDIVCSMVTSSYAFHSPLLSPLREAVTEVARKLTLLPPHIPYISNVTGTWITDSEATNAGYWATHMCQTVRFADGVQRLLENSDNFVLEVGPGRSLSSFVKQHPACGMERMPFVQPTLPLMHERQSCKYSLSQTIGRLWQAGVGINWIGFHTHEQRHLVALPIK